MHWTSSLLNYSIIPWIEMSLHFLATTRAHNGHGERSEPSLNRSDDCPAPENARFFVRFLAPLGMTPL
jgi:hypothetical protein